MFLEAPLTSEEIAAIDEAGAKGPLTRAATTFTGNAAPDSRVTTYVLVLLMLLVVVAGFNELVTHEFPTKIFFYWLAK
jgi:hypothetical protein